MNILFFLTPKQDVNYVYEDFTLRQTLEKMRSHRYAAVPIIKRSGEYVGTLTEGDLLRAIMDKYAMDMRMAEQTRIMDLERSKTHEPVRVDTDVDDLFSKILHQNFVPVIDDRGVFIGIVTRRRVLQHLYDESRKNQNS